ncbi:hypothetical protein D3C73_1291790 [compost metagenome]
MSVYIVRHWRQSYVVISLLCDQKPEALHFSFYVQVQYKMALPAQDRYWMLIPEGYGFHWREVPGAQRSFFAQVTSRHSTPH